MPTTAEYRRALNRISFGVRPSELAEIETVGWAGWVEGQVKAPREDDPLTAETLLATTFPIIVADPADDSREAADPDGQGARPSPRLEMRTLDYYLGWSQEEIWSLFTDLIATQNPQELFRVNVETQVAMLVRAGTAQFQLREVMADFWHNHFSVFGQSSPQTGVSVLSYDRDTIRPHVLGNFRDLLVATAQAPAMLFYLDNADSRAETPNENYAREVLELHSFGEDAYLAQQYASAAEVPKDAEGWPIGFAYDDIVQVSRALSGWTVAAGQRIGRGQRLPQTGTFHYEPAFHNPDAGYTLGIDVAGMSEPMAQGLAVLDAAARNPRTARFVVGKIVNRLLGAAGTQDIVDGAVKVWRAHEEAPDQIAQTLSYILMQPAVLEAPAVAVRRPYERMIAHLRALDAAITPNYWALQLFATTGDAPFAWPSPDGRPETPDAWLTTSLTRTLWSGLQQSLNARFGDTMLLRQTPRSLMSSPADVVDFWIDRILGAPPAEAGHAALIEDAYRPDGLAEAIDARQPQRIERELRRLAGLIASASEFAYR